MKFLSRKVRVGLDFGSTCIKIAGLSKGKDLFKLEFYDVIGFRIDHSAGLREVQHEILRELKQKYELQKALVNVTLSARDSVIRTLDLQQNDREEQCLAAIRSEFSDAGFQVDEPSKTVYQMFQGEDNESCEKEALACILPSPKIDEFYSVFVDTDITVRVLDLDAFGVYNAVLANSRDSISGAIHIGAEYSICIFKVRGRPPFFTIFELGGNQITEAISKELKIDFTTAERLKKNPLSADSESNALAKLDALITEFATSIATGVKKCLLHVQSCHGETIPDKLWLSGGSANLISLPSLLESDLSIKTSLWSPEIGFENVFSDILALDGVFLAPAIGTALRGN